MFKNIVFVVIPVIDRFVKSNVNITTLDDFSISEDWQVIYYLTLDAIHLNRIVMKETTSMISVLHFRIPTESG